MSETFDPYHKWLGIPPYAQPASYYRLLGVEDYESDADVIESAADQRMAHVRRFQSGQHAALSQQLLNELSRARLSLLDPDQRRQYDERLRAALTLDDEEDGEKGMGLICLCGPQGAAHKLAPSPCILRWL